MLGRSEIYTLQLIRKRSGTLFSMLPADFYNNIIPRFVTEFDGCDPNCDVAKLLRHIVLGTPKDIKEIKRMLDANPRLVLESGNVTTRSGLKVKRTPPLECAIAAGDPDIVALIDPYFDRIEGGAALREESYNRYRPIVENILNPKVNPPYDIKWLLDLIIKTEDMADVKTELNLDIAGGSLLHDAMEKFRTEYTKYSLREKKVGMHRNYLDVIQGWTDYDAKFEEFGGANNNAKRRLVCRQIISFMHRSDASVERFRNARGYVGNLKRSLEFKYYPGVLLMDTAADFSRVGLGFEYCSATFFVRPSGETAPRLAVSGDYGAVVEQCRAKARELIKLMRPRQEEKSSRCVIC